MVESKERKQIKSLQKGQMINFPMEKYIKITRLLADINMRARSRGELEPGKLLYSASKKGAEEGTFNVIRK